MVSLRARAFQRKTGRTACVQLFEAFDLALYAM